MLVKTKKEEAIIREAGHRLTVILERVTSAVKPGATARELNELANQFILAGGDKPAFLGYQPVGASRPFPAILCVSVNDEVVHGIPNEGKEKIFQEGDIVSLDLGFRHEGFYADMAVTVGVGDIAEGDRKLIAATREALARGVAAAHAGAHVGDIGAAIEKFVKPLGYGIVRELGGHGVGRAVHELPYIPNYGVKGKGSLLKSGMVLAIEPMLTAGSPAIVLDDDGYTYRTKDGAQSAHFENTILVTKDGGEVLI